MTVFGTFDPSIVSQKSTQIGGKVAAPTTTTVNQTYLRNNSQGTSQVSFKGEEDLGGGLKAMFLIENDFHAGQAISSSNLFSGGGGELYLGVSGELGTVKLGAANTPSLYAQLSANPFGTKIGSGFGVQNTARVRTNNSIVYNSPSFSGFKVDVALASALKDDANVTKYTAAGSVTDIGLSYANGPLAAGVSVWKTGAYTVAGTPAVARDETKFINGTPAVDALNVTENKQTNFYITYDLGVAKLGVGYYTEKQDRTAASAADVTANKAVAMLDSKASNVSISVPMGAVTIMANYMSKDVTTEAGNLDAKVSGVGVKYALSKRTSLYGRYVNESYTNALIGGNSSVKTTLVGLQHNF